MKLTHKMVLDIFEQVLDGRMTREQASRWAYTMMQNDDCGVVEFDSRVERDRVSEGLDWLLGADLEVAPGEYFHSMDDIRDSWNERRPLEP